MLPREQTELRPPRQASVVLENRTPTWREGEMPGALCVLSYLVASPWAGGVVPPCRWQSQDETFSDVSGWTEVRRLSLQSVS